ncbi:MAG: hypothetical protein LUD19_03345 [Clostridia bacterium]|nr:hypothetical protein [Clostridia bacterium]
MKDLKTLLFKKTAAALREYQTNKKECPEADWELDRRTFCALFNLITESGLEDEYYAWKEAGGEAEAEDGKEEF